LIVPDIVYKFQMICNRWKLNRAETKCWTYGRTYRLYKIQRPPDT
jgi:hypothetical protein